MELKKKLKILPLDNLSLPNEMLENIGETLVEPKRLDNLSIATS
jgi:hypothetical protein